MKRKNNDTIYAFTLAEVLITLGIIGVVAALTIPILMQNAGDAEIKTAFKKSYSSIMQAYDAVVSENGGTPYKCYYDYPTVTWLSSECSNLWAEMSNKLKVAKTYTGAVDGINIPNYTASDSAGFSGTVVGSCSSTKTAFKSSKEAWTLADGSMIMGYYTNVADFSGFILDTNGMRKPNKWGYDIFMVSFNNYTPGSYQIRLDDHVCPTYETGGFRTDDILLNK